MPDTALFFLSAAASLWASWLLVSRLERIGNRLGVTEAMLGLLAALAADAPEITSAIGAMASHQQEVGAGVVVGSNVFNLAALLGLGATVAGWVALHRRVVVLTGFISIWIAGACVLTVLGAVPPAVGLLLVLAVMAPYVVLAARRHDRPSHTRAGRWLVRAVREEEVEIHPALVLSSSRLDVPVAIVALAVVVAASLVMEHTATSLGRRWAVPDIVVGGIVLAAVTSLPNAVAAVYLARKGRGTAMLSTALNSNAINILVGLLLPATIIGLGVTTGREVLIAAWYGGLTAVVLVLAYRDSGLRRAVGVLVLGAYGIFVVVLDAAAHGNESLLVLLGPLAVIGPWMLLLVVPRPGLRPRTGPASEPASGPASGPASEPAS